MCCMENYKNISISLAKQAGGIIRDQFTLVMKKKWKADYSPVTVTDVAVNRLVIDTIQKNFSTHSIRGEEESALIEGSEYVWACDPIDGTIPFSHGIPTCVFSLALVRDGAPILGVIYDPFLDRLFFAEKGKGATMNDQPIHVSPNDTLDLELVGLEMPKHLPYQFAPLRMMLAQEKAKVVSLGSTLYTGMLVAGGAILANIFTGKNAHDAAALSIIVEEAGGKVTDIFGNDQRYDREIQGCIASNGLVHEKLLELVRRVVKSQGNDR